MFWYVVFYKEESRYFRILRLVVNGFGLVQKKRRTERQKWLNPQFSEVFPWIHENYKEYCVHIFICDIIS